MLEGPAASAVLVTVVTGFCEIVSWPSYHISEITDAKYVGVQKKLKPISLSTSQALTWAIPALQSINISSHKGGGAGAHQCSVVYIIASQSAVQPLYV